MNFFRKTCLGCLVAIVPLGANAAETLQIGTLSCDVSKGIGMFVVEKQTMSCVFRQTSGGNTDKYAGSIDQYGVALGETAAGHLIWSVVAATGAPPAGALAGTYAGVGANASVGVGAGANVLVGGTGKAFSLQPISVEGQEGINIAGGVTTVTLTSAP
ncbi:DUF992 domain-containing protein [Phyllobacterium brassicacearum]|uniref:DUF992 domain-containing protein n=1 Tax=Phyllobacterium brassicacearum TaxID=314235 RepID=A0A2P7B4R0_9HYPH|nr:DUF992 domain-containing protein [Phyllobacterium brassicacearum]PSH61457.1 DUF992 domain-containing protein [Phyllobacterium brassicacearum]TDQ35200.1 uncharacterized protein DUF992 [Phyllobacterium brassicacearum]